MNQSKVFFLNSFIFIVIQGRLKVFTIKVEFWFLSLAFSLILIESWIRFRPVRVKEIVEASIIKVLGSICRISWFFLARCSLIVKRVKDWRNKEDNQDEDKDLSYDSQAFFAARLSFSLSFLLLKDLVKGIKEHLLSLVSNVNQSIQEFFLVLFFLGDFMALSIYWCSWLNLSYWLWIIALLLLNIYVRRLGLNSSWHINWPSRRYQLSYMLASSWDLLEALHLTLEFF